MDNFSYSLVRSFNQFFNTNFSAGTDEQLILKRDDKTEMNKDTAFVEHYDERLDPIGGGRQVSGSRGWFDVNWVQIDCYSPPNAQGQSRDGAHRKFVDKVNQVFTGSWMLPLVDYGTAGTTEMGRIRVRKESAARIPAGPEMEGWNRTTITYRLTAVNTE